MTDPVILLGTQSNGETLPVQVDGFGRLVAEGLQGSEGPPGEQGPPGADGGSFPLPPDPYEGALLGWLDGGLAWVGTPPVPIPPGVFGPITAWDAESGLLTVEGEIPAAVGSGVYLYQCNQDGSFFTDGWNISKVWSELVDGPSQGWAGGSGVALGFDGDSTTYCNAASTGGTAIFAPMFGGGSFNVRMQAGNSALASVVRIDGILGAQESIPGVGEFIKWTGISSFNQMTIPGDGLPNNGRIIWATIEVNNAILVDTNLSLNFRVNQVFDQNLIGVRSSTIDFTIGKYLYVPNQRVAPWVLYGNDPTSLIDHLRSS